jgi:hypothetical protein
MVQSIPKMTTATFTFTLAARRYYFGGGGGLVEDWSSRR